MSNKEPQIITVEQFLNTKTYVKPNGGIDYKSPAEYLNPFLEIVEPLATGWTIKTAGEVTNKNDDGSTNVSYARVAIEAIMPSDYTGLEHDTRIGFTMALDIAKPFLKVYTGKNAWACTNLSIFNADHIYSGELTAGWRMVYDKTKRYVESLDPAMEEWIRSARHLMSVDYSREKAQEKIGYMLEQSLKNNFSTGIVKAARELNNPKSIYSYKDNHTTAWNILSATTQYITDSVDVADRPDRTLFAHEMFQPELASMLN